MYKILVVLLAICNMIWLLQYCKMADTYDKEIAELEYVIHTGEHCVDTCVELFEKTGC